MRRLFFLLVLALGAAVVWTERDRLRPFRDAAVARWQVTRAQPADSTPAGPIATEEQAEAAQAKLEAVRNGGKRQVSFTGTELQSLLQFRYRQLLPAFIDSPRVELEGDRLRLRVRLPVDRMPALGDLGEIASLLPDTTDLDIHGQLLPADPGHVAFAVDRVSAHRIPLPRRLVPNALELLGRRDRPGLPEDAILIPLPRGTRAAYVRGDSLVLLADARAGSRD